MEAKGFLHQYKVLNATVFKFPELFPGACYTG
jgi:hypothetical protein